MRVTVRCWNCGKGQGVYDGATAETRCSKCLAPAELIDPVVGEGRMPFVVFIGVCAVLAGAVVAVVELLARLAA